jgi:peptide-methionine (R)-S-oxide reductase
MIRTYVDGLPAPRRAELMKFVQGVDMNRRTFVSSCCASGAAYFIAPLTFAQTMKPPALTRPLEQIRTDWKALIPANASIVLSATPADKRPNAEWKKTLGRAAYHVLRDEGTEPPGASPFNNEKRRGIYACAGCGLALFTSEMKYDSGTGWPSFFTSIPGHMATKRDFKLILPRTEYHCIRCEGHQGHLFNDGPKPTGERWCNNGVALRFVPSETT